MRANLITGTVAVVAAAAMNSVYGGAIVGSTWESTSGLIWGAGLWIVCHAPAVMAHVAWQDFSCVLAAVHGCAWVGTALLMTVIAGVARR